MITGAIGDYGNTVNAKSAGKPQEKGGYELLVMKKGTILLNGGSLGVPRMQLGEECRT